MSKPSTSTATRVIYDGGEGGAGRARRGANYIIYLHTKCNKEVCVGFLFLRVCRLTVVDARPFAVRPSGQTLKVEQTDIQEKNTLCSVPRKPRAVIWPRRSRFRAGGVDALEQQTHTRGAAGGERAS